MAGPIRCATLAGVFLLLTAGTFWPSANIERGPSLKAKKAPDEEPDHAGVELSDGSSGSARAELVG